MIDEVRKLVTVEEIRDAENFTGAWRGTYYDCRAVPDTSSLAVGSVVVCHVVPNSTQLVYLVPTQPGFFPIVIWSGSIASIPEGFDFCDGTNGTPDLRNKYIQIETTAGLTGGASLGNYAHTHVYTATGQQEPILTEHQHEAVVVESGGIYRPDLQNPYGSYSFLAYSGVDHTHTLDLACFASEYPDNNYRHTHTGTGTTSSDGDTYPIDPPHIALAYMKANTPVDLEIGQAAYWDGLGVLPANYSIISWDIYQGFALAPSSDYVWGEFYGGDSFWDTHVHDEGTIVAPISGAHWHVMSPANWQSPASNPTSQMRGYINPAGTTPLNLPYAHRHLEYSHDTKNDGIDGQHVHPIGISMTPGIYFSYVPVYYTLILITRVS